MEKNDGLSRNLDGACLKSLWAALQAVSLLIAGLKRVVIAAAGNRKHAKILAGWKSHGTIYRSEKKFSCLKESMSVIPSSILKAMRGATTNHTRVLASPGRWFKRINSSSTSGIFVVVHK